MNKKTIAKLVRLLSNQEKTIKSLDDISKKIGQQNKHLLGELQKIHKETIKAFDETDKHLKAFSKKSNP